MKRSDHRILTTHAGSLPRPADLLTLIQAKASGQPHDPQAYATRARRAVAEIVRRQADLGLDIVDDGEMGKPGFIPYVNERLAGFEPDPEAAVSPWKGSREVQAFPEFYTSMSISPTSVEDWQKNTYYRSDEEYLYAIADAMREEYTAIVEAGFLVQIDDPHIATHYVTHPELSLAQVRRWARVRIEALNHALRDIPRERVRWHTCYGINIGPRVHDMELKDLLDERARRASRAGGRAHRAVRQGGRSRERHRGRRLWLRHLRRLDGDPRERGLGQAQVPGRGRAAGDEAALGPRLSRAEPLTVSARWRGR